MSDQAGQALYIVGQIDWPGIAKELEVPLGKDISKDLLERIRLYGEKKRLEGVLLGLRICKEMWVDQGSMFHEDMYENEIVYKDELYEITERIKEFNKK